MKECSVVGGGGFRLGEFESIGSKVVPGQADHIKALSVLGDLGMDLGIQDGRVLTRHEPVSGSLDFLRDPIEGSAPVMIKQVGDIFKKQYFRAFTAKFPNQPYDLKKRAAPLVVEAELGTGDRERLARKSRGQHIDRAELVADD